MKGKTPLTDAIKNHIEKGPVSFHMPGHKNNKAFMGNGAINWTDLLQYDITELPGLDNLHCPEGAIEKAQRLTADAYGVDGTYFLVNGSTAGIIASLLTAARAGDTVVVDRGCHLSVYSALMLGRLNPVYVQRPVDRSTGVPLSMDRREVEKAIASGDNVKAVIITHPTYYGICSDVRAIADTVHRKNAVLIIDEAHGAHFRFSGLLPESAVDLGADIIIQSAHKTLPAMTQGSWLHARYDNIDRERLEKMLSMLQSTSPSYPVMASLDNARFMMEKYGARRLKELIEQIQRARLEINASDNGLYCPDRKYFKAKGGFDFDDTKMLINCTETGLTGHELYSALRESHNIYGELYDSVNWLGIITAANDCHHLESLIKACKSIKKVHNGRKGELPPFGTGPVPAAGAAPYEILDRSCVKIEIDRAKGKIAGAAVVPYPPGIPIICPGERFDSDVISQIKESIGLGITIKGIRDGSVAVVE